MADKKAEKTEAELRDEQRAQDRADEEARQEKVGKAIAAYNAQTVKDAEDALKAQG